MVSLARRLRPQAASAGLAQAQDRHIFIIMIFTFAADALAYIIALGITINLLHIDYMRSVIYLAIPSKCHQRFASLTGVAPFTPATRYQSLRSLIDLT